MTSDESKDIDIEFVIPNRILFPCRTYSIPKNQLGADTDIKLNIRIVKNTPNDLVLNKPQPFIPELLTSDGQIIQGNLVAEELVTDTQPNITNEANDRKVFEYWKIRHELPTIFYLTAKLFWLNKSLKLKIPTIPNYWLSYFNPNYFWHFDGLEAKNYQLRFILNIDSETIIAPAYDIIGQSENRPTTNSNILATPWQNIRLVKTLPTDSNAIEVDGAIFKIKTPESMLWTVPSRKTKTESHIKLDICATNNTPTPLCFYQAGSVDFFLRDEDGKEIKPGGDFIRLGVGFGKGKANYYLVQPGESAFFNLDAIISSYDGQPQLAISNRFCNYFTGEEAYSYFWGLKLDKLYQLQIIYHIWDRKKESVRGTLEKVSTGWIAMPFIEFRLVKP